MPIVTAQHDGHGAPRNGFMCGTDIALVCDCYDGTEDGGRQAEGVSYMRRGMTLGETWVEAAIAWNECVEEMEDGQ